MSGCAWPAQPQPAQGAHSLPAGFMGPAQASGRLQAGRITAQGRLLSLVPSCCRMFETLSFLPPLTDDQISKQVDYIVQNGRVPW